ncbi:MAG: DASS family sodium-coupled anion symporter [Chlamydiia bacterium]|nr:DASS family sodium-coupled anion symporter [Chlamydiia bacterium]
MKIDEKKIIKFWCAIIITALAGLVYTILPPSFPDSQKRVLCIFIFAAGFWAFEVIPIHATSLLTILFLTFFLSVPDGLIGVSKTGYTLFLIPFSSPVIMLFFGGFVLATALHKHKVDEYLVENVISRMGKKPWVLMISYLLISAFFSMWMSNTAATALMLTLVKPILSQVEKTDPFRKGIVLAIAFGANIGGIGTPIGTPPNALAMGFLAEHGVYIDFFEWMVMAIPLVILILILASLVLLWMYRPISKEINYQFPHKVELSQKGIHVIMITFFMLLLWLTSSWHGIPEALVALLGVGILTASQLVSSEDLKKIDWDILILMWGGLALGIGMEVSGLLDQLIKSKIFMQNGIVVVTFFSCLAILLSSFMSNTATANILLPIAISISSYDKILLSITVAISCSLALAFPVSTPPNAMVFSLGTLRTRDMFKAGALIAVISLIIVLLGFDTVITRALSKHFID